MEQKDRRDYIERYEARLSRFGHSPEALGWGKTGRQEVRFSILSEAILECPTSSVMDVGCGFGDLYDFLTARGWHGRYSGIDIVPGLLEVAKKRHPNLDLRELDITAGELQAEKYDFVVASGVFNARLRHGDNLAFIESALRTMYGIARIAVAADFMSTHVDFQHPDGWHTDPAWAFALGKKLSRRVVLRHDYMPFEFALVIYCDDSISCRNVFQAFERILGTGAP
jgi:SAM-dependent methyltransferase